MRYLWPYIFIFHAAAYDGWKEWTLWSVCTPDNTQQRRRRCAHTFPSTDQCQGAQLETRMCRYNLPESLPDPALQRTRSMAQGDFQIYHLIITGEKLMFQLKRKAQGLRHSFSSVQRDTLLRVIKYLYSCTYS